MPRYQTALREAGLVDFDDLVMLPARLLAEDADVAATLHARYAWIAVDEYQDVNLAQVELLRRLAAGGANVCVIGDPDQAIYGFRGADHRFFGRFAEDFPGAVTVHLRRSYRSPQSLLDAAGQVIAHNADAAAQQLVSDFTAAVKLTVLPVATDRAEAETVVHRIEQMVGGTSMFSRDSGRVGDESGGGRAQFCRFRRAAPAGHTAGRADRGVRPVGHPLSSGGASGIGRASRDSRDAGAAAAGGSSAAGAGDIVGQRQGQPARRRAGLAGRADHRSRGRRRVAPPTDR